MKYLQITLVTIAFVGFILIKNGFDKEETNNITTPNLASPQTPRGFQQPTSAPLANSSSKFKDGSYTGSVEDAFYGYIQVQAVITGGKLTDVVFLQYPNDNRTSISINSQASVFLRQEAIAAQSANVDIISGASDSSMAFVKSLGTALRQAGAI